jgi:DNA-binding response OmpR family regulator
MKRTVLVVDDDPQFTTFVDRTLKRAGFSVVTANDGCEVPDILHSTRVDVLLLDLQMPGVNGWQVLRHLKDPVNGLQRKAGPRPKVVVISGRNEDETVEFVRRLGADAYMMKPLWGDEVLSTVRGVLED